jgi:hypothetical protein
MKLSTNGFRALAVIEQGQCRFFSRKKHKLTGHQDLRWVPTNGGSSLVVSQLLQQAERWEIQNLG